MGAGWAQDVGRRGQRSQEKQVLCRICWTSGIKTLAAVAFGGREIEAALRIRVRFLYLGKSNCKDLEIALMRRRIGKTSLL